MKNRKREAEIRRQGTWKEMGTRGMLMEGVETKKGTDFRVGALRRKSEDIATAWL